jgi:hypothetical protein
VRALAYSTYRAMNPSAAVPGMYVSGGGAACWRSSSYSASDRYDSIGSWAGVYVSVTNSIALRIVPSP